MSRSSQRAEEATSQTPLFPFYSISLRLTLQSLSPTQTGLCKTSEVNYSLYFSIFQMTLKTYGTIQFKTAMTTRKTFSVRYNGTVKEGKIRPASGFPSVSILSGTSVFLTWKELKSSYKASITLNPTTGCQKFLRIRNGTRGLNTQRSGQCDASSSVVPAPTSPRPGWVLSGAGLISLTDRSKQLPASVCNHHSTAGYYL